MTAAEKYAYALSKTLMIHKRIRNICFSIEKCKNLYCDSVAHSLLLFYENLRELTNDIEIASDNPDWDKAYEYLIDNLEDLKEIYEGNIKDLHYKRQDLQSGREFGYRMAIEEIDKLLKEIDGFVN